MDVLAALGDAPTAVIAVVAIVLGVVLAARGERGAGGKRGERAAHRADDDVRPSLLKVPRTASELATDADGPRTMAIGEVGHGPIRLGRPDRRVEPAPAASHHPPPEPATSHNLPPVPATSHDPPHDPATQHDQAPEPATLHEPPPGAVPFRQGTIKLRQPSDD